MTLGPLGQIAVTVRHIERATAFYADVIGLRLLFRAGGLSFFDCGGLRLMLSEPEGTISSGEPRHDAGTSGPHVPPPFVLYFRVDDIDAAQHELSGRGVTFISPPHIVARMPDHDLWLADFHDGEGNTFALMEERKSLRAPRQPTT